MANDDTITTKDDTKSATGTMFPQPTETTAQPSTTTEQVVVTGRPLEEPVEPPKMGSAKAVRDKMSKALEEGRAKNREQAASVDHTDAKIIPNIGQPRAQSSEEIRQDQEDQGNVGGINVLASR